MYMFGGWDYSSVISMVDTLVYGRRYGGFYEIIENFTIKELLEVFTVIRNKEAEQDLEKAMLQQDKNAALPTEELSQDMIDFLMGG